MDAETNHRHWSERSGEFSPTYYAHLGPNTVSRSLVAVLDDYIEERPVSILELGCSSGRHLAHLLEHGFEDLHGVDLNAESFEVMADYFPDLAGTGTFRTGAIEHVVTDYSDDEFDVVFSVETLQHIHPDNEWVFDELSRITRRLLVTVENEGGTPGADGTGNGVRIVNGEIPLYYRDWGQVFTDCELILRRDAPSTRGTLRVFEQPPHDA